MLPTNHFAPVGKLSTGSGLDATSLVSITALAGVPGLVRDVFGETALTRANEAAMLDIEAIEDQDCFIPHATMTTFANALARSTGEEHFGLFVAPYLSIASYGCWGEYILAAPTLGEAIERGRTTINYHSKGDVLSIAVIGGQARFSYLSAAKGLDGYAHVACGTAGAVDSICRAFLSSHWRPHHIELDIPKPRHPDAFEAAFGCPVHFDAPTVTICFDETLLSVRNPRRRAPHLITVDDLARARADCEALSGIRDVLAEQIWSQVLAGNVSIESAAQSLNTSVRTLQRELHRDGTDFRSLTNIVRSRRALELLRHTDASVSQIASSLGYSAPTHFARAFRKATGFSPQEFRRHRSPEPADVSP